VRSCTASAPAKTILLGEHWVVHGGRALAAAVGLYAHVSCRVKPGEDVWVYSKNLGVAENLSSCDRLCNLAAAARYIEKRYGRVGAECHIRSDIPPGVGLGSSAAVAVAFSAAYLCLASGAPLTDKEIVSRAAFEAEKVAHGNPSGIDNTVSTYGGIVLYRRGSGPRVLSVVGGGMIAVVDSGVERSTRSAVEMFAKELSVFPRDLRQHFLLFNDMLVGYAVDALRKGDYRTLGKLFNMAHGLLKAMGVSSVVLDTIVEELRVRGAYGAKLSGAGLGGVVIASAERDVMSRLAVWAEERGLKFFKASFPVRGVHVEYH